ncbi:MAG: YicC family protein [Treponema sp.]|jgi:uncharacterized protein (TIGR00255 family)|nr:YicC family protein [Treponema sp.]
MKSMTGYAFREEQDEAYTVSVEIKGYNTRYLETSCYLPPRLSALETRIRSVIAATCKRGKIDVVIRFKEQDTALSIVVNKTAVSAYAKALEEIVAVSGDLFTQDKLSPTLFLSLEGILEIGKERNDERVWHRLEPVLVAALEQFDAERAREGIRTEADISCHVKTIEDAVTTISACAPTLETSIRENIKSRFKELLEDAGSAGLGNTIDENRILAETAVMLMKYTIREELSRLATHLVEFRAEAERNPSPGKKLDFLCQEINREINTIGSKTPILEVSRAVVNMKDALENIREQLRNIE